METNSSDDAKTCPKCPGTLIQGFIPDYSYASVLLLSWFPGSPTKGLIGNVSASQGQGVPMAAFRCDRCGFVEFYAMESFKAVRR